MTLPETHETEWTDLDAKRAARNEGRTARGILLGREAFLMKVELPVRLIELANDPSRVLEVLEALLLDPDNFIDPQTGEMADMTDRERLASIEPSADDVLALFAEYGVTLGK